MSTVTTQVVDTSRGAPAEGLPVHLEHRLDSGDWVTIGRDTTDADGRADHLVGGRDGLHPGTYRLTFDTGAYFDGRDQETFFPWVPVVFHIRESEEHHHVPLHLSPYGLFTCRGS
ncbi:MAG: hydroxyisourate hydrolase [Myxococcota bacterium]